jgi:hypothetical protein
MLTPRWYASRVAGVGFHASHALSLDQIIERAMGGDPDQQDALVMAYASGKGRPPRT